jgi:hypothetical protein
MVAKLTRMTHKITIQLQLVAESRTICSSRSRRSVRKLLDTPSYNLCSWMSQWNALCISTSGSGISHHFSSPYTGIMCMNAGNNLPRGNTDNSRYECARAMPGTNYSKATKQGRGNPAQPSPVLSVHFSSWRATSSQIINSYFSN